MLADLGRRQATSVLIEGGGQMLGQAFAAGVVDELNIYLTPWVAGGPDAVAALHPARLPPLHAVECERLGPDVFLRGFTAAP